MKKTSRKKEDLKKTQDRDRKEDKDGKHKKPLQKSFLHSGRRSWDVRESARDEVAEGGEEGDEDEGREVEGRSGSEGAFDVGGIGFSGRPWRRSRATARMQGIRRKAAKTPQAIPNVAKTPRPRRPG